MSESVNKAVISLQAKGIKVRGWLKEDGIILRLIKGDKEVWAYIVNDKIVANC